MDIAKLAQNYAVAAQIQPDDVVDLAAQGFVAVICNRPDDEDPGQPPAAAIAAACADAGLLFHHIPFAGMPIPDSLIAEHREACESADGQVLGFCRSGQRSAIIWQAGQV